MVHARCGWMTKRELACCANKKKQGLELIRGPCAADRMAWTPKARRGCCACWGLFINVELAGTRPGIECVVVHVDERPLS
jgi:hypothetical protein